MPALMQVAATGLTLPQTFSPEESLSEGESASESESRRDIAGPATRAHEGVVAAGAGRGSDRSALTGGPHALRV